MDWPLAVVLVVLILTVGAVLVALILSDVGGPVLSVSERPLWETRTETTIPAPPRPPEGT